MGQGESTHTRGSGGSGGGGGGATTFLPHELTEVKKAKQGEIVTFLQNNLTCDVNVDIFGDGTTMLTEATRHNYVEVVGILLSRGADVNHQDRYGVTALMEASYYGFFAIAHLLMEQPNIKVNLQDSGGRSALMRAARCGRTNVCQLLLKRADINVNIKRRYGDTALIYAVRFGYDKIFDMIIDKPNVDVNLSTNTGWTALMWAAHTARVEMCEHLLQRRTDTQVNLQTKHGLSALIIAAKEGHSQICSLLINHPSIDIHLRTEKNQSALDCAVEEEHTETIELLKRAAAKEPSALKTQTTEACAPSRRVLNESGSTDTAVVVTAECVADSISGDIAPSSSAANSSQVRLREDAADASQPICIDGNCDHAQGLDHYFCGNVSAGSTKRNGKDVVIVGGGIHGISIAYYLMKKGVKCIIIERVAVAAAASGKAGGFLARHWGDGPTEQLHHISYDMHADLARELDLSSYRALPTVSVSRRRQHQQSTRKTGSNPTGSSSSSSSTTSSASGNKANDKIEPFWLNTEKYEATEMGSGTAQVTPLELTAKMLMAVLKFGSELIIDTVIAVARSSNKSTTTTTTTYKDEQDKQLEADAAATANSGPCIVKGVYTASYGLIPAEKVVFAMGPWTGALLEKWFGNSRVNFPMEGIKSTSIVLKGFSRVDSTGSEKEGAVACFCDEDENDCHLELYPRPNGDLYVCGCGGSDHVKGERLLDGGDCEHAALIEADPARCTAALSSFTSMSSLKSENIKSSSSAGGGSSSNNNNSSSIAEAKAYVEQACMRPCPADGLPVMSKIPGIEGAYVSAGHNCWGILWAPVSGLAMAELMVDGHCTTVDLNPFKLSRFMPAEFESNRGRKRGSQPVGEQW